MDAIKKTAKNFAKGLFKPDNKLSLIPNWLSFSRVIGGISIPIMAYTGAPLPLLFGNVTFLAISDFLDGLTARVIAKEETKEGAMLDAVSDKIFSIILIIGILPILPIFAINGVLEGGIALINGKLLASGGSPKSNLLGKVKIWPLSIALILGYLALAIQNLNIAGITNETLLTISTALSIGTMPLQGINIKQYFDEYKKQTEKNQIDKTNENHHDIENELSKSKEKEKTNENEITPKFILSKENHQAMVYELDSQEKNEEKTNEKPKTYTKRNKH
ncbi:phosphatidylglycerophosphate synthase [Firmicutes bacterium CAG:822]|nr:phosphatidylglycerophosphate synthase [Firmicutes bacterium CAG:822]